MTEEARLKKLIDAEEQRRRDVDLILQKTSTAKVVELDDTDDDIEEEENLLYFIMKKSPTLDQWKREILRIVYKINQYFYPQGQTQTLNEGFASFTHYHIMTRLEEKGFLSPDAYVSFLDHHTGVITQRRYNNKHYNGFNPYALGFAMLMDVKRICQNPTEEDKEWFPHLIGKRWQDAVKHAVFEHRDDGFIAQYLSPKVIRDLKLFSINLKYEDDEPKAFVSEIHDDTGYRNVRTLLAKSKERINMVPQIAVVGADLEGDRTLKLKYTAYQGRGLNIADADIVTDYVDFLWGYSVELDC
jgi:spore cortex formation protein SpoVR/YcgB (stage V sporulation)